MSPLSTRLGEAALELLRVDSPIGHEQALADRVEAWARARFTAAGVTRVGHSLVAGPEANGRPTLALVGHLDTVPPNPAGSPPQLLGDRLFGLGASDMKGALAVMMALADDLPLDALPYALRLVFYEREEGPFLESGLGPLMDARPDLKQLAFAVAMEPTDLAVQVGCVGSLHVKLVFHGQSAHAARPWQGKNAVHAAGGVLVDLEARGRKEVVAGGYSFFEVMSATVAQGGHARNVVPDRFELNVNVRFAPGKSDAEALEELRALVNGRAELLLVDAAPSGRVCAQSPHFQRLLSLSGRPAEPKQAWTDVARLSSWGLDAVNFGPGETAQAHQKTESASVRALEEAYDVLARWLRG